MSNYLEQFKMFLIGQALEKYCGSYDPHNECMHFCDVNVQNEVIGFNNGNGDKFELRCQGALESFSCDLFRSGTDTYEDAHVYIETKGAQPVQKVPYDPYCHRFRNGLTWRNAFIAQCAENGQNIGFPAYGVTLGSAKDPILRTGGQQDCIVIVIHDKRKRLTLLAHLPTSPGESSSGFHESERYMAFFKNEYFRDTPPQDLEVTVITAQYTPASVTERTLKAIQKDFGSPKIEHKDHGDIDLGGDMRRSLGTRVDSRTGDIKTFLEWGY